MLSQKEEDLLTTPAETLWLKLRESRRPDSASIPPGLDFGVPASMFEGLNRQKADGK
jgi:hypothetical protein